MAKGFYGVVEGKTKRAERILPLTPQARECSLRYGRILAGRAGYFDPGNSGHLTSMQKSYLRALRKAELKRFPFYSWSYTFGTRCEIGMNGCTLTKLMGQFTTDDREILSPK
jgi:integrase